MKFQFDPEKAKSSRKQHNVSFADAEGVFYDPLAIHTEDSYSEDANMGGALKLYDLLFEKEGNFSRIPI